MRCDFNNCAKGLLNKDYSTLDKTDREHVRKNHWREPAIVVLHGVCFRFHRLSLVYICCCEKSFTTPTNIEKHVTGTEYASNTRSGCRIASKRAEELAMTREVCLDENEAINYWPADLTSSIIPHTDEENSK